MAKRTLSVEGMKGLHRVKAGKHLFWPKWLYDPTTGTPRGSDGYVVDLDQKYEAVFCENQASVLQPAPAATAPSPIEHKPALLYLKKHGHLPKDYHIKRISMRAAVKEREERADIPSDLPGLDEAPGIQKAKPKAPPKPKQKELDDAVQGAGNIVEL